MKGGFVKKGLIFVMVVCVLVAIFWFAVVDWMVEWAIESEGSKAVGAKVDVSQADLSLFPAGIEILGLEVTNPDHPMQNAMAVGRVYSDIELLPLIRQKVIINNLRMERIRLNTPRKTSGALPNTPRPGSSQKEALPPWLNQMCAAGNDFQFSIPKVDDILSTEKLQSLEMAKTLRSQIDAANTQWQKRLNELPAQKDFDAYKSRLSKLKASGTGLAALVGSANEFQSLQADVKKDLDRIKQAQKGFQTELADLKRQSAQLAAAPAEEVRRLKAKYALSPEGAANLSRMLFGPKVCDWWKKGYHWYARLQPYLSKATENGAKPGAPKPEAKTKDQKNGMPDLLIRQVHIDALLDIGQFTGLASDISSDPQIWGKPVTFKFLGRQLKQIQSINMNGIIDFIQPDHPKHSVKLLVQQYALQNLLLSDSENLPLSIAKAMADINMDLNLNGPKLDALVKAQLDSVQMAVEKAVTSELNKALFNAIESVTRFGLTAMVEGTNPDYSTTIKSDLDKILQQAVGQIVKKAGNKLESQLRTAIAEKTRGPIGDTQNQLAGLDAVTVELSERLNLGNNVIKNIKLPF